VETVMRKEGGEGWERVERILPQDSEEGRSIGHRMPAEGKKKEDLRRKRLSHRSQ